MTEPEYLKIRVDDQIDWYNAKSAINKKMYHLFQVLTIVLGALVTLSAVLPVEQFTWMQYVSPVFGAIITVSAGVLGLYKFQEKWIKYRTTCESLQIEKNLYLTKSGAYNSGNGFNLFVNRIESVISEENSSWAQTMQEEPEQKEEDS